LKRLFAKNRYNYLLIISAERILKVSNKISRFSRIKTMKHYDFDAFLEEMARLDFPDILTAAERIGRAAEKSATGGHKGVVQARKMGALAYSHKIGAFLFFIRYRQRPSGVDDKEFKKYMVVVQPLIQKEQLKPSVLELFEEKKINED
jgi:hypothetical protein